MSGVVGTLRLGRNVLRRLAPHRGLFALAVLQVLVIGLLELAKPWPLKVVVDGVLGGKPAGLAWLAGLAPRALLAVACAALVGIYALLGLLAVTSNYATISVSVTSSRSITTTMPQRSIAEVSTGKKPFIVSVWMAKVSAVRR